MRFVKDCDAAAEHVRSAISTTGQPLLMDVIVVAAAWIVFLLVSFPLQCVYP